MSKVTKVQNTLTSALHGYKDQAAQVKDAHRIARQAIKDDPMTSDLAKRGKLDALASETKSKLAALKDEQAGFIKGLRDKAERDLRGPQSSDANSILLRRDAAARARKIDDKREALDVLEDAIRNGDSEMAHAIGTRARNTGMVGVAEVYQSAFPDTAEAAEVLAYVEANGSGAALNMSNSITFSAPQD
ncbi:hypothetical protein A4X17_05290 [Plantibacter sp. H53]|uniref:hypothetical protein n=1 Tax=Plantibacter sp. H53 TaxID=1827323 RepID=UPI0007D8E45B|nr:hypothetical protein [Plantibacter sp. H53]OAN29002.1 hypothetical protein A4X17_05290 [Plantibacter sp. H53]